MVKRMYIAVSLLSMASIMNGMEQEVGKRSALDVVNHVLDAVVGKVEEEITTHAGTITTVENELGALAHQGKEELTLLGVTPKGAYEAAVVFGTLYVSAETVKYIYYRHIAPQPKPLDPHTAAVSKSAGDANKNVDVLGQFISTQQINGIVEAKWKELMDESKLADKDYVNAATSQIRNMVTSALETNAGRVTDLERDVKGLAVAIHGDATDKKTGIVISHEALANRVVALENLSGSSSGKPAGKGGGMMSKMFGTNKNSAAPAATKGIHPHDDDQDDDDDNKDNHATEAKLHGAGKQNKDQL